MLFGMKRIHLTEDEKAELESRHSQSTNRKEGDRIKLFFKSSKEFRSEINRFFEDILPEIGGSLSSRINDNFQLL